MIANTFKCFKTMVRVLVFLLLFQCSAIKGRVVFLLQFQTLLGYYWCANKTSLLNFFLTLFLEAVSVIALLR